MADNATRRMRTKRDGFSWARALTRRTDFPMAVNAQADAHADEIDPAGIVEAERS